MDNLETLPIWKQKIANFINHRFIQNGIVALIILNAALLGMETSTSIVAAFGHELVLIDHVILCVFILEIVLLITIRGVAFFKDPWCVFDFLVVGIALVPATESLSILRALRVLRVLRLINKIESMRKVVTGLLNSLPSLASVAGLTLIIFYVSSVVATNLFGHDFPALFGDLGDSAFTLFQVMTLESWSDGVARPIMEKIPYAWVFFIFFILIATFIVINLFIAVIVDSLNNLDTDPRDPLQHAKLIHRELIELKDQFSKQQQQLEELTKLLATNNKQR
jgi:voltage-gated sodium channel